MVSQCKPIIVKRSWDPRQTIYLEEVLTPVPLILNHIPIRYPEYHARKGNKTRDKVSCTPTGHRMEEVVEISGRFDDGVVQNTQFFLFTCLFTSGTQI